MSFSESGLFKSLSRVSLVASLAFAAQISLILPAQAETFVVAALDGYGIGDCLSSGGTCGRIVADAWCESHGLSRATAFGRAGDITASIGSTDAEFAPDSIVVSCAP